MGLKAVTNAASQLSSQLSNMAGGDRFVFIGDSRCAQMFTGNNAYKSATHYWNWANALNTQCMKLGAPTGNASQGYTGIPTTYGNFGISGFRSDQFLGMVANGVTNLAAALQIPSQFMVFDPAAVNDIGQASATPYTNLLGQSVTISNVASVAAANIQSAALQALALGKKVIVVSEQGATGFNTAQVGAVFEYNLRMRRFCAATNGCFFFDMTSTLWNPTSSSIAIAFKANYSVDGTHYTALACYSTGLAFNSFIAPLMPVTDIESANIADNNINDAFQLTPNPLFNVTTGGSTAGAGTVSGTVPGGWQMNVAAGITATFSNAANANGFGNDITIAFNATAAAQAFFITPTIPASSWTLTDTFESGIECTVAAGSSNMAVYYGNQIGTNAGAQQGYDLFSATNGPAAGYTAKFNSLPCAVMPGSISQTYAAQVVWISFTAAGSGTVTLRRPWFNRYSGF